MWRERKVKRIVKLKKMSNYDYLAKIITVRIKPKRVKKKLTTHL